MSAASSRSDNFVAASRSATSLLSHHWSRGFLIRDRACMQVTPSSPAAHSVKFTLSIFTWTQSAKGICCLLELHVDPLSSPSSSSSSSSLAQGFTVGSSTHACPGPRNNAATESRGSELSPQHPHPPAGCHHCHWLDLHLRADVQFPASASPPPAAASPAPWPPRRPDGFLQHRRRRA